MTMDGKTVARALAALRVFLGFGFLWAGLSKFLMIGATEPFTAGGFLKFGTSGSWPGAAEAAEGAPPVILNPTHDLWVAFAGNATALTVVDTLVVFGQIAIGAALILGLATRFAGVMGGLMMTFLTVAAWDFGHGLVNQTSLYAIVALVLAATHAGRVYGLDGLIERASVLREHGTARRFVGAVA
jgi:thiosulfate dehydrogenase [quinone] large subunit